MGVQPHFEVPPQDPESRVGLFQAAQIASAKSMDESRDGLLDECSDSAQRTDAVVNWTTPVPGGGPAPDRPYAMESLAANLVEALQVGEDAADRATAAILGIAESDASALGDLGRAARLTWFDDNLSRLVAAQGQVGGTVYGSVAVPTDWQFLAGEYADPVLRDLGIGVLPACRAGCTRALDALRTSGVPFSDIVPPGTTDVSASVADLSPVVAAAAANLNARVGWDATAYDGSSPEAFAQSLGVHEADLLQAVEQMRYEAIVHSRPVGVTLAQPIRLAPDMMGAQVSTTSLDPTTLMAPVATPAMHYLTRARSHTLWDGAEAWTFGQSLRLPRLRPERAYLFAYARAVAAEALNNPDVTAASPDGRENEAASILGTIAHQATARRALDVEVCGDTTNLALFVRVFGLSRAPSSEEFRFVVGLDALRCATQGSLAGQPCQDSSTWLEEPHDNWLLVPDSDGRLSRRHAVSWTFPLNPSSTDEGYVVRLRPGATGGAGAYEAIAGFPLEGPPGASACTTIPYDFQAHRRAAEIFSFTADARESTARCGDVPRRLPLEDEVIDDGDRFEDSWMYHLRVASSVAQHADFLGQQLIEAGLEIDRASALHVDQLDSLCGTHINLDPFAENIHPSDTCNEAAGDLSCPDGHECIGTACVLTGILGAAESSQRAALEDCLGLGEGGEIIEMVALGRSDLCAWRRIAEPDQFCTGSNAPCPFVRQPGEVCALPSVEVGGPDPVLFQPVVITNDAASAVPDVGQTVGLVGSVAAEEAPEGAILPGARPARWMCDAIDGLRSLGTDTSVEARDAHLALLRTNTFFTYDNIRSVAGRIGWRADLENYSGLTVDGSPLRDSDGAVVGTTGSPETGPATQWPCRDPSGSESDALFATNVNCALVHERARMNWRLGRAAVTLTALSGLGLSNHRMPAFGRDYTGASMATLTHTDVVRGRPYVASTFADFGGHELSGDIYAPIQTSYQIWQSANNVEFWADTDSGLGQEFGEVYHARVNGTRPFSFLDFGTRADERTRAENIARRLWGGIAGPSENSSFVDSNFFEHILEDESDLRGYSGDALRARERQLFLRALTRSSDNWSEVYLRNGRGVLGETSIEDLTHLFSAPAWTPGGHNLAHVFPSDEDEGDEAEPGYGAYITRRDLLDAMELACRTASYSPPPPDMVTDEDRPQVNSMDDVGQVQFFAERVASSFDALSRVQVVRDVPQDVVDRLTTENVGNTTSSGSATADRVEGEYGRQMALLRTSMRTVGVAPAQIAQTIRAIATELQIMERNQAIFERSLAVEALRMVVDVLHTAIGCLQAVGGKTLVAGGLCGLHAVVAVAQTAIHGMQMANLSDTQANEFDAFALRLTGLFDQLDSDRTEFLNAVDSTQSILGSLRQSRRDAQSALAGAMFSSSDAAGRNYATNTVMRRMYDVNLHRYEEARDAAVRSGALARFAIEQRFGVDLEAQQCAQLVDSPASWANDICNATGVNYSEIRDPDVTFDDSAARQMFIGDYVRRLEQYVESYRFDYPFQSADDLLVLSMRDDIVRAPSACVGESVNWIGASNQLGLSRMPLDEGAPGSELAWAAHGCVGAPPYENCVRVTEVDGPRYAPRAGFEPPEVQARQPSQPPRGFEVRFAPRVSEPYSGDYQNGASHAQELQLPAGLYRLSWYQRANAGPTPAVDVRNASGTVSFSGVAAQSAEPRALDGDWDRLFRLFDISATEAAQPLLAGVFAADVAGSEEQSIDVAGIQLEYISGTQAEIAHRDAAPVDPLVHGPSLFAATTSPGVGLFDDCVVGDGNAFRRSWRYDCAQLCSGGFSGHCDPGEEATEVCFWELPFSLDEDRLLARGGGFGGGFAFGNYNYRSGDAAVNVVGTGVRTCEGENASACFSTAGIPYSLVHNAPSSSVLAGGAYTIRAHDGSLHDVDLFDGRIESARALAAERYLSNPLSSADSALLADYTRGELRGRPITGNYRLLIWDTGEVDFGAIEDVQILLRYRYFTRTGDAHVCSAD